MIKSENQISKSKELWALSSMKLNLPEFKILDIYLSRIDPRCLKDIEQQINEGLAKGENVDALRHILTQTANENATVEFTVDEYCDVLEIEKRSLRPEQLKKYIKNIMCKLFIDIPNDDGTVDILPLFSLATFDPKNKTIKMKVNIEHEGVKRMFFDVNNFKYIKYRLENTIKLESIYSFKLYLYLLDNKYQMQYRGFWDADLKELKKDVLGCKPNEYKDFRYFNRNILKKCHDEINEKTNIEFEYEPIKCGRSVGKIRFKCHLKQPDNVIDADVIENNCVEWNENGDDYTFEYVTNEFNQEYQSHNNRPLDPTEIKILKELYNDYTGRFLICGLFESVGNDAVNLFYVREIVKEWKMKNLSIDDVENGKR